MYYLVFVFGLTDINQSKIGPIISAKLNCKERGKNIEIEIENLNLIQKNLNTNMTESLCQELFLSLPSSCCEEGGKV